MKFLVFSINSANHCADISREDYKQQLLVNKYNRINRHEKEITTKFDRCIKEG